MTQDHTARDEERQAAAAEQLVEHVAADGSVIEVVTRAEMRRRSLRHRSVYIAVLDANQLLIHKRADWKDVYPGAWDLAFGGVCDVGESWVDSAERELLEEAGVQAPLIDCGPVTYDAPDVALIGRLYRCEHTGPFRFDDGEVTETRWLPLNDLDRFVATNDVPEDSAKIVTTAALAARGEHHRGSCG